MSYSICSKRVIFLFLYLCFSVFNATETYQEFQKHYDFDSDKVVVSKLPGQPSSPPVSQFSGYITVNQDHGRSLFYWFFEAQSQSSNKPLLLWFNGGPGCSSIGYGAAVELGPFRVNTNGLGLHYNNFTWNKEANLLFVESPVGVGFSYTNTSSDLTKLDDEFVAEDAYNFLVNWLHRFPHFKSRDIFFSGESYAGHYVPQLAELVNDRNTNNNIERNKYPLINLKGFIVGNPETDDYFDSKGLLEYAWSHSVVSDEVYEKAKAVCDFKKWSWSNECNQAMNVVYGKYREIDIYNIYAPICVSSSTQKSTYSSLFKGKNDGLSSLKMKIPFPGGGYDPCYSSYTEKYFNRLDVQSALHVHLNGHASVKWQICNNSIFRTYNYSVRSILPIYNKLKKAGLKIWVYSGDADGRVPVIGSRYSIEALGLPLKTPSHSWYHHHQVGGRIVEYEGGLSLITVRGAGHLVPLNKPSEALALIHSYLTGEHLPTKRR